MSFTKRQRDAGKIYQNIPPDQSVEADHMQPKSKGGADDVANLQFIDPASNRVKAANDIKYRDWQERFLDGWDASSVPSFLCVATPGGGKTIASLAAVHDFLQRGHDRRVLIAVPTDNLRRQWRSNAERLFGIKLQTKEFGTSFKQGFIGGVATYQALDHSADLFRKICSTAPTLAVLDEPHHLADCSSWGGAAKHAFELAARRLLLSGTPFRTDGRPIPFVRYDGAGVCVPDFRYDYPDALLDNVIRTVTFDHSHGSYEVLLKNGDRQRIEFRGDIADDEAAERLQQILKPSDFVAGIIRQAHAKLIEIRRSIPDAGAMAVCMDIRHALGVAKVIRRETGCDPSIVVSDEERMTDTIDSYRDGRGEWIVSVRQISEGTDIKRLQVLAYLTHATTELMFRQLIGRVSRVRFQEEPKGITDDALTADLEAFVFLPADPRLIELSKHIEDAQMRALRDLSDETRTRQSSIEPRADAPLFLGSEHGGVDCIVIAGKSYTSSDAADLQDLASCGITMKQAAKIFDAGFRRSSPQPTREPSQLTEEERMDPVRTECNKLAFRYARMVGCDVWDVHKKWPKQETMGLIALEAKKQRLNEMIAEAYGQSR